MDLQERTSEAGDVARSRGTDDLGTGSRRRDREVTMFNRKAIVVLASIAGMTAMVVSFAFNTPARGSGSVHGQTTPAEQASDDGVRRNYLSAPPDTARMTLPEPSGGVRPETGAGFADQVAGFFQPAEGFDPPVAPENYEPYAGSAYVSQPWIQEPAPSPPNQPSARELAFHRAMRCGIRSCPAEATPIAALAPAADGGFDAGLVVPEMLLTQGPPANGGNPAPAPRDRHQAFLEAANGESSRSSVAARIQRPASPYQIMAGTLIPVTLVTAINSDLPGEVVAQVTRNVYDTQQRHLLIPAGSRVLGRVDNQVGLGQARLNIAWHRLIFPNNNSLSLPGFGGVDAQGAAGIRDRVNNHVGRTYLNAMLLSAITAGAQLSQPQSASVYSGPTAGQIAAGALGQQMGEVSSEMVRRNMEVGPTLEIRPGFTFSIYVSQDLILSPYDHYQDN